MSFIECTSHFQSSGASDNIIPVCPVSDPVRPVLESGRPVQRVPHPYMVDGRGHENHTHFAGLYVC